MTRIQKLTVEDLPKPQEVQKHVCCLYVIQEGDESYFKIGIAGHVLRRQTILQSGNRRRLKLVAAYAGTRANCLFVENVALKFFKASPSSSWVSVECVSDITDFLDAFCGGDA